MKTDYLSVNCQCELRQLQRDWIGGNKFTHQQGGVDDHQLDVSDKGKEGVKNECQNFGSVVENLILVILSSRGLITCSFVGFKCLKYQCNELTLK